MLSPSCLVWQLLNLGNYFIFFLLAFILCSGNLESPFALWQWLWTSLIFFFPLYVCFSFCLTLYVENLWNVLFLLLYFFKKKHWFPPPRLMPSLFFENGSWFRWLLDSLCYKLLHDILGAPFPPTPVWKEECFFNCLTWMKSWIETDW